MNHFYLEGEHQEIIRFKTNESYSYIDLLECDNPYCGCGECQMVFLTKAEYEDKAALGIPLVINVYDKNIQIIENIPLPEEQKEHSIGLKQLLEKELKEEDWDLLKKKHKSQKEYAIAEVNLREVEYDYEFTKKHVENETFMISYQSIFPLCELFKVTKEETEYEVVEQYCKNPRCECTSLNLHIFKDQKYVEDFSYDYEKDELEEKQHEWIIKQLKENYPGFKERIQIRDLKIKSLYTRYKVKLHQAEIERLRAENKLLSNQTKVGRNDKCPCGSGKKYKKCCLNK